MATVGAAGTRRNEARETRASSHEEGSKDMRVYQARGGVAGTAQAAKAGGHPEETAARGGRGKSAGRGGRVANGGDTGEEEAGTARRAVKEEHERIYQKVVAEHQRYMERAEPYKSLRYIRELAEAGKPKEIRTVRLQCGRVTGSKKDVLEKVAQSFRRQHNQGQQELSGITRRMVRALLRVFTAEQSEDIHRSRVTLGEIKEAVKALKGKKRAWEWTSWWQRRTST